MRELIPQEDFVGFVWRDGQMGEAVSKEDGGAEIFIAALCTRKAHAIAICPITDLPGARVGDRVKIVGTDGDLNCIISEITKLPGDETEHVYIGLAK